ncbi:RNA polymerase sigma factor [Polyangium jinanense]|uniref:RNA polymerase sigma factor n=1 Tax=Polyangium jinanense TaxID=2829994 RepID=UPI00233FEF8D|nr:sigma factor-like helix-turn-helix DNA-binding protein [Polyangium jinanense]
MARDIPADDVRRYLEIARRHMALLQYTAREHGVEIQDVDDVVSSALVSALKFPEDKPPPPPEDEGRVKAWLVNRVKWTAIAHRSQESRSVEALFDDAEGIQAVPDELDVTGEIEHGRSLDLGLKSVRPEHARVMLEHEVYDVPVADIARDLNIPYATAYSHLRRGKQELREALEKLELPGVNPPQRKNRCILPLWWSDNLRARLNQLFHESARLLSDFLRVPLRVCANLAAVVAVVAFTPSDDLCAFESRAAPSSTVEAESRPLTRVQARGAAPKTPAPVPVTGEKPADHRPSRQRPSARPSSPAGSTPAAAWDLALAIRAANALARGDVKKGQALLDADERARGGPEDPARRVLRADVDAQLGKMRPAPTATETAH